MQNAKYPLILAVVINSLNVGFNLLFVRVFDMNVDGVALGTLCANYLGIITALVLFKKSYGNLQVHLKLKSILDWVNFKKFFVVGRDIFIRTLMI